MGALLDDSPSSNHDFASLLDRPEAAVNSVIVKSAPHSLARSLYASIGDSCHGQGKAVLDLLAYSIRRKRYISR